MNPTRTQEPTAEQAALIRKHQGLALAYCGSAGLSGILRGPAVLGWATSPGLVAALERTALAVDCCWAIYLFVVIAGWPASSRAGRLNKALILMLIVSYNLARLARPLGVGAWLESRGPTVANGVILALVGTLAALMLGILVLSVRVLHDGTARDIRAMMRGRGVSNRRDVLDDDGRERAIRAVGLRNAAGRMNEEP